MMDNKTKSWHYWLLTGCVLVLAALCILSIVKAF